jgi:hypothetical protein
LTTGFGTEVWKEWRLLPERIGGWGGGALFLAMAAVLGVLVPWQLGFEFLSPNVLLAYGFLAPILAAPFVAAAIAGDPVSRNRGVAAKVIAAGAYGWTAAAVFLAAGLITVNIKNWRGEPILPPAATVTATLSDENRVPGRAAVVRPEREIWAGGAAGLGWSATRLGGPVRPRGSPFPAASDRGLPDCSLRFAPRE